MARNRTSAKKAGASFERLIANYLAEHVDDRIDRQIKTGNKDIGDIAGLRHMGGKIIIEAKDYGGRIHAGPWTREAAVERGNADGLAGIVVAKRRGTTSPAEQYVLMELGELVALLTGSRDHYDKETNQ